MKNSPINGQLKKLRGHPKTIWFLVVNIHGKFCMNTTVVERIDHHPKWKHSIRRKVVEPPTSVSLTSDEVPCRILLPEDLRVVCRGVCRCTPDLPVRLLVKLLGTYKSYGKNQTKLYFSLLGKHGYTVLEATRKKYSNVLDAQESDGGCQISIRSSGKNVLLERSCKELFIQ